MFKFIKRAFDLARDHSRPSTAHAGIAGNDVMAVKKISPALAKRRKQSAIVSRMMITIVKQLQRDYRRKHIGQSFEELLVAMKVRAHEDAGKPPITISDVAKFLNMPRSNARRALEAVIHHQGIIRKDGRGFITDPAYHAARIDAENFAAIRQAIITAADELRE
ncbi:helix-turn-helix domain-containing protein [Bradyrhizobium diazoefficiens]|jgi:hypothetical protein